IAGHQRPDGSIQQPLCEVAAPAPEDRSPEWIERRPEDVITVVRPAHPSRTPRVARPPEPAVRLGPGPPAIVACGVAPRIIGGPERLAMPVGPVAVVVGPPPFLNARWMPVLSSVVV